MSTEPREKGRGFEGIVPFVEVTVQQGGGGFMRHAARTPLPQSHVGHFYGWTLCARRGRRLRHDAPPRAFTATDPDPKPTWNGGQMNRYCPACIKEVATRTAPADVEIRRHEQ